MEGVAGFVEKNGGKVEQVQPSFDELRVRDHHLNAFFYLSGVPSLALIGWHVPPEYSSANAFPGQNLFQPRPHILFLPA
jgi:hypothetical protein